MLNVKTLQEDLMILTRIQELREIEYGTLLLCCQVGQLTS